MGILSRFRTSSVSLSSPQSHASVPNGQRPTAPTEPKTPTPASPNSPSHDVNHAVLSEPPARPSVPPSSPSTLSVTSRISRKPWKRTKSHQPQPEVTTPVSSLPGKGKGKWGAKEDGQIAGMSYEELSPPRIPPSTSRTASLPVTPQRIEKRITMFHNGQAVPSSPLATPTSPVSSKTDAEGRQPIESTDPGQKTARIRPNSGLFKQEGGPLGRLGFEVNGISGNDDRDNDIWVDAASVGHGDVVALLSSMAHVNDGATVSEAGDSAILIEAGDIPPHEELDSTAVASGSAEDGMEIIESPEKKTKFWKGNRRARRASKAASDHAEIERSNSPTPRKPGASAAPLDLVESQPTRPQQLRRPSSSLFHNPFNRTTSRASLALDLEKSPVDDGSFQLRGFRHVSGTSDVEGASGLEGYLTHVRKESMVHLPSDKASTFSHIAAADNSNPPSSFIRPRMQSSTMSRPPSVAGSLASMDDYITSSNRVSVAAFRKGIRRPSEVFPSMSDVGHGGYSRDDEDDLPLGVLNTSGESSNSRLREKCTASLSSMRDLADGRPDRQNSPSPALSFTVQRHQRGVSGGFLVKSTRYTRPDEQSRSASESHGSSRPATFATPPTTGPPSPAEDDPEQLSASPGQMDAQAVLTPVDSYFATTAPAFTENPTRVVPAALPLHQLKHKPDFNDESFPSPLPTATKTPSPVADPDLQISPRRGQPPPVKPINLPEPGDAPTPASLVLPLPPDQMPDTPPKHLHELSQRVPSSEDHGSVGTGSAGKKRLSLLDEPMRIISGLWTQQPSTEDGIDPALVLTSMNMYGENDNLRLNEPCSMTDDDENRQLHHQPSRSTLFDIRTATPAPGMAIAIMPSPTVAPPVSAPAVTSKAKESIRSPLSERLANVTLSSLAKPSLSHIKTSAVGTPDNDRFLLPSGPDENVSSVGADETVGAQNSPAFVSTGNFVSSFARAKRVQSDQASSSDESNSEDELDAEAKRRVLKAQQRAALGSAGSDTISLRRSSGQGSTRRVPGGPRKPSVRNRMASSASTPPNSDLPSQPLRGERQTSSQLLPNNKSEIIDSDDDEPLAVVRKKASRSSISLVSSPPSVISGLPSPRSGITKSPPSDTMSLASSNERERRRVLVDLGPISPPLRDQSVERPRPTSRTQSEIRNRNRSMSSTRIASPASPPSSRPIIPPQSPVTALKQLSSSDRNAGGGWIGTSASPASSVSGSGTTNTGDSSHRLMTPRESTDGSITGMKDHRSHHDIDKVRQYSKTPQPQSQHPPGWFPHVPLDPKQRLPPLSPTSMQMGMPPIPLPMPMPPMDPNMLSKMDPSIMQAMMKQQWQMQFMAAAYRASEEQWERASSASGQGPSSPNHAHPYPLPPPAAFPPFPLDMGSMGQFLPYPHPYSFNPSQAAQGQYPFVANLAHHGQGGGMYSYAPAAQSVFGGDFGPPRVAAPSHLRSNTINNAVLGLDNVSTENEKDQSWSRHVNGNGTGSTTRNIPNPPSSWRRTASGGGDGSGRGGGEWEAGDIPTPRKSRPQSTFIN